MLIQGAGGNASWKEGQSMWIKASGTWLADAEKKDIFVHIDTVHALELIVAGVSDLSSACIGDSSLRPSIETCLHALLAQRVVVHFHAVNVIALAVRKDAREEFARRLRGLDWAWVDYVKPGPDLARAVMATIGDGDAPSVLVLGNHGLVIAADSLEQLQALLSDVLSRCSVPVRAIPAESLQYLQELAKQWQSRGYILPQDTRCHALALDPVCLKLSALAWVLYPDHAVFLGAHAAIVDAPPAGMEEGGEECYIVPGCGVVVRQDLSPGQLAMLACYANITLRIGSVEETSPLSVDEISDLLNWDAEKYRQSLNAA